MVKSMWPEKLLTQIPNHYSTLYVDMNSFFASVEQFYDPQLRGRPVAVCAGLSSGSTVIAASAEAKACGVRTGTKVGEARQRCPLIVLISDSPHSYRAIHSEIMAILHATRCYVGAKSIDEAFLVVPSYLRTHEQAFGLAKAIKSELYERYSEHVLCSIGVSSNIWLAKMGSNVQKPNGLVHLARNQLESFYKTLRLSDMTGVGGRMARRFYSYGIGSPYQLYQTPYQVLQKALGVNGARWYLRLRGYEVDFEVPKAQKSLGHQVTTMPNPPSTIATITTLCIKVGTTLGYRLRNKQLKARGIYLNLLFTNHLHATYMIRNAAAFDSDQNITLHIKELLKKLTTIYPVKRVSITLLSLTETHQLKLPVLDVSERFERLARAMDNINNRFGKDTVSLARAAQSGSPQLDKVGFAGDQIRE